MSKALEYAKRKGFHCQLMMNAMFWNPAKVAVNYPRAAPQISADGKAGNGWLFCPDSPDGWQLAVDEVSDLLGFYADSPVDSFAFERMGYGGGTCHCAYPVPIKTPEMIREYARWLEDYPGNRVRGAMFFNEVRTTERIKKTVYEIVGQWMA